jgi:hypothetical protein
MFTKPEQKKTKRLGANGGNRIEDSVMPTDIGGSIRMDEESEPCVFKNCSPISSKPNLLTHEYETPLNDKTQAA